MFLSVIEHLTFKDSEPFFVVKLFAIFIPVDTVGRFVFLIIASCLHMIGCAGIDPNL
jgi:hypothetical protein